MYARVVRYGVAVLAALVELAEVLLERQLREVRSKGGLGRIGEIC